MTPPRPARTYLAASTTPPPGFVLVSRKALEAIRASR